jgi:hypothetical protein
MWSSVQGKSYTAIVLVTLIFAVWHDGHETRTKLVRENRGTRLVPCQPDSPCPTVFGQVTTIKTTDVGTNSGRGLKAGPLRR